jgi:hypothetical protein
MTAGPRALAFLSQAAWLNAQRARAYAWMLLVFMAVALFYDYLSMAIGHHPGGEILGPPGKPQATDFTAFWAAGHAVWGGHVADAYSLPALSATEHATAIMDKGALLAFFYPPTFLLLCLPFAFLPYLAGFFTFVSLSLVALAAALRRILGAHSTLAGLLPVLAFPGLLMNAATGQTGFWSASCFAWALLWLQARPGLAGACLGCLVIKPHLAIIIPIALTAARRWRALLACAATASGWIILSWALLGNAAWRGFLGSAAPIRDALENHPEDWGKLQSLFTTLRLWGASLPAAYAAQILLAACVAAVTASIVRRRPGGAPETALMASASMLCTPHILDYDLAATGVPLAWIAGIALRSEWLPWEKALLGLAFLWPLAARLLTQSGMAPLGPFILLGLFGLTCRRALRRGSPATMDSNPC